MRKGYSAVEKAINQVLKSRPPDVAPERILADARRKTKLIDLGTGEVEDKLGILGVASVEGRFSLTGRLLDRMLLVRNK